MSSGTSTHDPELQLQQQRESQQGQANKCGSPAEDEEQLASEDEVATDEAALRLAAPLIQRPTDRSGGRLPPLLCLKEQHCLRSDSIDSIGPELMVSSPQPPPPPPPPPPPAPGDADSPAATAPPSFSSFRPIEAMPLTPTEIGGQRVVCHPKPRREGAVEDDEESMLTPSAASADGTKFLF